jgi:hypothetical protein
VTNEIWFRIFDADGQMVVNTNATGIPHVTDNFVTSNKLYRLKTLLNASPAAVHLPSALNLVSALVGNCHTTRLYGWWRGFSGYGCALRDYAFAVRSGRRGTNELAAGYLRQCESEILARATDLKTWSTNNSYGTSIDATTKNLYNAAFYFAGDRTFDLAVADRIVADPGNTNAIVENLNYEAGLNPINVSHITGLGSYRQREIVDQFSQNNLQAVLPKSGVPLGNISGTLAYTDLYGPMDPLCFPAIGRGSNYYALYDRWAEVHNVNTEFSYPTIARALASAAYLVAAPRLGTQVWRRADASIVFPNGLPVFGSKSVAQLTSSENLSQAQIVWDPGPVAWNFWGQNPAFGSNFTFLPSNVGEQRTLQAEAIFPDGRRLFAVTNFDVYDPVRGGANLDADSNTVALYHFDDSQNPYADSSGHGYTLDPYTNRADGVGLANNANWMGSPDGLVARFHGSGNRLEATIPAASLPLNSGDSVTLEGRLYPRVYQANSGNIFTLYQVYNSGDPPTATQLGTYFDLTQSAEAPEIYANAFPLLNGNVLKQHLTPYTWHSVKLTLTSFGTNATTCAYVDGVLLGSTNNPPIFNLNVPWTLILGGFDGDIDEVRISSNLNAVEP